MGRGFPNQPLRRFAPATSHKHDGDDYPTLTSRIPTPDIKQVNISLDFPTSPKLSYYFVKSNKPYYLCDTIEVSIEARNAKNESKVYGGDFFFAWIHALRASAAADKIIDHFNGTYTAKFRLHWAGQVKIIIQLVHSAEAVDVMKRIRDNFPARVVYGAEFYAGEHTTSVKTPCYIATDMYINPKEKFANMTFCNFTDDRTSFPWFCVKPKMLSCDTYFQHTSTWDYEYIGDLISEDEIRLISGPNHGVAGFYYKDVWHSLVCHNRDDNLRLPEITKCLQNHTLYFLGDSTIRQWYEHFARFILKESKVEKLHAMSGLGPNMAVDETHGIHLKYNWHGYPVKVHVHKALVKDIEYIPNRIDDIESDKKVVVFITIWAHFSGTSLDYYRNRLYKIKDSIQRLQSRNAYARVLIKSANTIDYWGNRNCTPWYYWSLDQVMREVMSGIDNVTIIDVWDMTIGHHSGYRIHPNVDVIAQETDMALSFLCSDD
ncbi:NXPE family member 3-like [Amphiura filiformis]|uniref:NXPE family member 3-like n=1 Tax=Amphiura filiformis TaxID=82378 RepID=UPI003B21A925